MVLATRLELFQLLVFWFPASWSRAGFAPCLAHFRIQNVCQTSARVRKCTCERKGSKRGLLSKFAPFSLLVNIRNVAKGYVFLVFHVLFCFYQAKRNFRWLNKIRDLYVFRFRSTHVDWNAPPVLIHTRLLYAQNHFRSTLVDRIVFPNCSNLFSLCSNLL